MNHQEAEQRKHPRVPLITSLEIRSRGKPMFEVHALLRNISLGGICFEAIEELSPGNNFVFTFHLPNGYALTVLGEVVWKLPAEKVKLYGAKFKRLGIFNWIRLNKYIRKQLKQKRTS